MGILKTVGDFLFGKDPDIFDEKGRVRHKFSQKKWQDWENRFKANPNYDWHLHSGKTAKKKIAAPLAPVPPPAIPATSHDGKPKS